MSALATDCACKTCSGLRGPFCEPCESYRIRRPFFYLLFARTPYTSVPGKHLIIFMPLQSVCRHICTYIYIHIHTYVHTHIRYVYIYMYMYMYIYICIYMCVCIVYNFHAVGTLSQFRWLCGCLRPLLMSWPFVKYHNSTRLLNAPFVGSIIAK